MDVTSATEAWVKNWQRMGPILAKIRNDELRKLSDKDSARVFQSLAGYMSGLPAREPRTTSGFVEQQRLLMKLRKT